MQGNAHNSVTSSESDTKAELPSDQSRADTNNVRERLAAPELEAPASRMLLALNAVRKPMYQGTVPGHVKLKRRKANKAARRARRS